MAEERDPLPISDFVSIIISPVLIMFMVGSLVFFLIEILYGGKYEGRLLYTFFFFVLGAVLIARISIQQSGQRAAVYGVGLGGACFLAMMAFVEYPPGWLRAVAPLINIGLMALVWWSANKLTWDCTHLAEDRKASGRGVLAAAGLDGTPATTHDEDAAQFDPDRSTSTQNDKSRKKKNKGVSTEPSPAIGWYERFQKYREFRKKRPHTPGVWVFYFALAALPLFGLGQSLIPSDDGDRRRDAFLLMSVYIASALGLLVTTTLMGLKRYLHARNAELSPTLTLGWLGLGGALILGFLVIGAVLPRPHSEISLLNGKSGSSQKRDASKNALIKDSSAGEGEATEGQKQKAGDGNNTGKDGKKGGNSGNKQSGGKQGEGKSSGGKQDGKQTGENGKQNGDQNSDKNDTKNKSDREESSYSQNESSSRFSQALETVGKLIKWLVWIALALGLILGLLYLGLRWLAPFTHWARNLLDWLRGLWDQKKARKPGTPDTTSSPLEKPRPPAFATFSNPFDSGTVEQSDLAELVRYTFAAFESWAFEQNLERTPDETPTELARKVGTDFPDLADPARILARLLMQCQFSTRPLPVSTLRLLEEFWRSLESAERVSNA